MISQFYHQKNLTDSCVDSHKHLVKHGFYFCYYFQKIFSKFYQDADYLVGEVRTRQQLFYLWILHYTQHCNQVLPIFYPTCLDDIYHDEGETKFCSVELAGIIFQQIHEVFSLASVMLLLFGNISYFSYLGTLSGGGSL